MKTVNVEMVDQRMEESLSIKTGIASFTVPLGDPVAMVMLTNPARTVDYVAKKVTHILTE